MNLSSYNSAFLCGLFADVASFKNSPEEETSSQDPSTTSVMQRSVKRRRVGKSLSRCPRSFVALPQITSPTGAMDLFEEDSKICHRVDHVDVASDESVESEINVVSTSSRSRLYDDSSHSQGGSPKALKTVVDHVGDIILPSLPSTVSDSSYQTELTRNSSDLQLSTTEMPSSSKDSYGWFVAMEEDDGLREEPVDPYMSRSSSQLAFQAPTAPNAAVQDAEVEWAKAADTVDDVLGDFF